MKEIKYILSLLLVCGLQSCVQNAKHPGYKYLPDMSADVAYSSYASDTLENGRLVLHKPVEGTVPREIKPYHLIRKNKQHKFEAGRLFNNPYFVSDSAILEQGQELYRVFCQNCHGENTDGKGYLHTSGKYMYPPANLTKTEYDTVPDGKLYHFITVGSGIMKSRASQITPDERWKIITYIRSKN